MRTREEIVGHIESIGFYDISRESKIANATLELLLDIRDALLDPERAKQAFELAEIAAAENERERVWTQAVFSVSKSQSPPTHNAWTCDEAHPDITHEQWVQSVEAFSTESSDGLEPPDGLEFGGAADQAEESRREAESFYQGEPQ